MSSYVGIRARAVDINKGDSRAREAPGKRAGLAEPKGHSGIFWLLVVVQNGKLRLRDLGKLKRWWCDFGLRGGFNGRRLMGFDGETGGSMSSEARLRAGLISTRRIWVSKRGEGWSLRVCAWFGEFSIELKNWILYFVAVNRGTL
jgi:hypothetical protein